MKFDVGQMNLSIIKVKFDKFKAHKEEGERCTKVLRPTDDEVQRRICQFYADNMFASKRLNLFVLEKL